MMSLRLREGCDIARYQSLGGAEFDPAGLQTLLDSGFVELSSGRLSATDTGRPVLNAILRSLIA